MKNLNKELALEKIEACQLMLNQIKEAILGEELPKNKQEQPQVGGEPYLQDGHIFCCGEPCDELQDGVFQCKLCKKKYSLS